MNTFDQLTDDELVKLYLAGSNKAFDVILSRYQNHIFSYVLMMVKDKELANDIFQDIFVKVITGLKVGQYASQGGGVFSNWLMRIAHNALIDHFRRESVIDVEEEYPETEVFTNAKSHEYTGSIEDALVKKQMHKDVWHMVEYLPDTQREVVNMRFRDELPFKEIARLTNVSINTSLGRMRYALINLRRMANQYGIF